MNQKISIMNKISQIQKCILYLQFHLYERRNQHKVLESQQSLPLQEWEDSRMERSQRSFWGDGNVPHFD